MIDPELERIATCLRSARSPRDVFGELGGVPVERRAGLKASYRRLSKATHPDRFTTPADRRLATETFARLTDWLAVAEAELDRASRPASDPAPVEVRAGGRTYRLGAVVAEGDLAVLYHCTLPDGSAAVLKVVRDPADNDLLAAEAEALRHLAASPALDGFRPYIPVLHDSFDLTDTAGPARRANLLPFFAGFLSLRALRDAFPNGLPVEHMGWIWRRLLAALAVTHRAGLVHGAVLPDHILIHPIERGLILIDWAYAVPLAEPRPIAAISAAYETWYPVEVWRKQPPTPATDLFLGARCMIDLLGGDPVTGRLPAGVPERLRLFLLGTLRPEPRQRPESAADLLAEFDSLLAALFGRRRYFPLHLPASSGHGRP